MKVKKIYLSPIGFLVIILTLLILFYFSGIRDKNKQISLVTQQYPFIEIQSQGKLNDYQIDTIRIHNKDKIADPKRLVSESGITLNYDISGVDDDFSSIRFTSPDGSIPYRRINIEPGKYADFILKVNVPGKGNTLLINIVIDSKSITQSTDEALEEIFFDGWIRQGTSHTGELVKNWGVENSVIFDKVFKTWFRGSKFEKRDYVKDGGVIRYAESADGLTWKNSKIVTDAGPYEGQVFVSKDNAGIYHMMYNDGHKKDGFNDYRYLKSTNGLPGSWKVVAENGFVINKPPGNIVFWQDKESSKWQCLFEYHNSIHWEIGYATGNTLEQLKKYSDQPVVPGRGAMVGGPDIHRVNGLYYMFGHAGEASGDLPTSLVLYKSKDLKSWTRIGWALKRLIEKGHESQIADPSLVELNGRTYMFYESQFDQASNNLPSLSLAIWYAPLERMLDDKITNAIGDDLEAEGWIFTKQYGEYNTNNLGTVFRKISHMPSDISKTGVMIKAENGRKLQVKKEFHKLSEEKIYRFAVYPEKVNGDFIFFNLLDKKDRENIKIWIDQKRKLNISIAGKRVFVSKNIFYKKYYYFKVIEGPTSFDIIVDEKLLLSANKNVKINNGSRRIMIEQNSDSIGYISTLIVTKFSENYPKVSIKQNVRLRH